MGKWKQIVQFEKENMPEYQYRFLYKRVLPGFFFVLGGAIFVLALGMILDYCTDFKYLPFIPLFIWAITTFVLLALYVIYGKKYTNRLISEKALEFDENYNVVETQEAVGFLEQQGMIVDDCVIVNGEQIRLDDCFIVFRCRTLSGVYHFVFSIYSKQDGKQLIVLFADKYLCSYFNQAKSSIKNRRLFELFLSDKRKFMKLLLRYNDEVKMEKHIE